MYGEQELKRLRVFEDLRFLDPGLRTLRDLVLLGIREGTLSIILGQVRTLATESSFEKGLRTGRIVETEDGRFLVRMEIPISPNFQPSTIGIIHGTTED